MLWARAANELLRGARNGFSDAPRWFSLSNDLNARRTTPDPHMKNIRVMGQSNDAHEASGQSSTVCQRQRRAIQCERRAAAMLAGV
eukprot:4860886-Pyramimonas_sp.AAC.1